MWQRIRGLWRPEAFHYGHRVRAPRAVSPAVFEGWYLKLVDRERHHPLALIPGVFLGDEAHAFVQVLDGATGKAWYHRYAVEEFEARTDCFAARVGPSRFSSEGMSLRIEPKLPGAPALSGRLTLGPLSAWPVTAFSPGVMGPYGFTPFMQCYHGILSLDHSLAGELVFGDELLSFDGGRGYIEKDWGRSFPLGYVWTQSNHFDREGVSVTASVATIPWLTGAFRGFLVGLLIDGELHRFTTYTGATIENLHVDSSGVELVLVDRRHRLEIRAHRTEGAMLLAPYEGQMLERVAETMNSEIELCFRERDGARIYEGTGRSACLEAQGDLARITG
jgi:hypothetical protein